MDRKIIWTEKSSSDIGAILRYIARRDPKAAGRIGLGIYDRVQILVQHPEAGTVLDELRGSGWRKLISADGKLYVIRGDKLSLEESGRHRWAKPIWKRRCDQFPIYASPNTWRQPSLCPCQRSQQHAPYLPL